MSAATRFPEYGSWTAMKQRCLNPKSPSYPDYGGRGITVCDAWQRSFHDFVEHVGFRPSPKHSIDRIDNDGNYEPGNVRWATAKQQVANRRQPVQQVERGAMARIYRTYPGSVALACKRTGLSPRSIEKWLRRESGVRSEADSILRELAAQIIETDGFCIPYPRPDKERSAQGVLLLSVARDVLKSDHNAVARFTSKWFKFGISLDRITAALSGKGELFLQFQIRETARRMMYRRLGKDFVLAACRAEAERLLKNEKESK